MYESVSGTDNADQIEHSKEVVATRVVELLGSGRAGLVTDIDGTISPISARPDEAIVLPAARRALQDLRDRLTMVAVVSGRSVADAREMVDVEGLMYVGNHGLEVWNGQAAELLPEARAWVPHITAVLDEVARKLEEVAARADPSSHALIGTLLENKGATASIHYRLSPDPPRARLELLDIISACVVTGGLLVEEGRMVINLLPPLTITKGSAVTWLAREHHLERLVYLGDDLTDAHAFRALNAMRQSDGLQALGIAVVGSEIPPGVRELADLTLPSVACVADMLSEVADRLGSNTRGTEPSDTMESRVPTVGST